MAPKDSLDVNIVVYVGGRRGVERAIMYRDRYSVLLGLETMIYHNWTSIDDISGLLARELRHVLHMYLRGVGAREREKLEEGSWPLLRNEVFAMKCGTRSLIGCGV